MHEGYLAILPRLSAPRQAPRSVGKCKGLEKCDFVTTSAQNDAFFDR
jgi:hypothetical protein